VGRGDFRFSRNFAAACFQFSIFNFQLSSLDASQFNSGEQRLKLNGYYSQCVHVEGTAWRTADSRHRVASNQQWRFLL
jgi:hypothetical protein